MFPARTQLASSVWFWFSVLPGATPAFYSHPMLLTHDAFYRTEGVPAQREIKPRPAEIRLWSAKIGLLFMPLLD
jgi:hypothetical protein